ncbi:MAG: hypothetical protein POELPBGB_03572 [Bacteroidia bacterium]|nr:hypothetical protein [Bacteroidia bacterium]
MKFIRIVPFLYISIMLSLSACAQRIPEGGPCSYETEIYPAVIINIYEMDSLYSELFIAVHTLPFDTLSWSGEFGSYLANDELKAKGYKLGDTLSYQIKHITQGTCNPYIKRLSTERYNK